MKQFFDGPPREKLAPSGGRELHEVSERGGLSPDQNLSAALFAVNPVGIGGVALRAPAGAARDEWLALLRSLLPPGTPVRRIPLNINDAALLGGLDLGATLQAGRPISQKGVLTQADGGVVILAMAERVPAGLAAKLAGVLDTRKVAVQRDGLSLQHTSRLGLVALDEGASDDEQMPAALLDRMGLHLIFDGAPHGNSSHDPSPNLGPNSNPDAAATVHWQPGDIEDARARLPQVVASDDTLTALCATAAALGVQSLRAPWFALQVAQTAAALAGLSEVGPDQTRLAARLVLAPRATQIPVPAAEDNADSKSPPDDQPNDAADPPEPQTDPDKPKPDDDPAKDENADRTGDDTPDALSEDELDAQAGNSLAETVLEAAVAAIPPGLLAALKVGQAAKVRAQAMGKSGAVQKTLTWGRPMGSRRGEPRGGSRLNVIETLRAAAPWQRLRQREVQLAIATQALPTPNEASNKPKGRAAQLTRVAQVQASPSHPERARIQVRREDFHVSRFKQVGQTTTLFVVDASGSSALNRLAEAKGAVELLLADCYIRRDSVAVLAFRGKAAELLLPPTRSLARAKRSLAGLPGGGGTPLASAIDAARELADQIRRKGATPIVVLLTDGRGNIARDGTPGRVKAAEDALAGAKMMRLANITCLLMDTSPQPQPAARQLAQEMGATYVPLPYAGAQALSQVVRAASAAGAGSR